MLVIIAVVLIVAALLINGALQAKDFSVLREADFNATPAKVFPLLNDFRNWTSWSPWEGMDPDLKRTYTGAAEGVGSHYAWAGNKKVGAGNMEITHSEKNKSILLNLNFIKPFEAHNVTEFTLASADKGSHLKWEMRGQRPFLFRTMSLFFKMDKIVGKDFERGLANIRALVEK